MYVPELLEAEHGLKQHHLFFRIKETTYWETKQTE